MSEEGPLPALSPPPRPAAGRPTRPSVIRHRQTPHSGLGKIGKWPSVRAIMDTCLAIHQRRQLPSSGRICFAKSYRRGIRGAGYVAGYESAQGNLRSRTNRDHPVSTASTGRARPRAGGGRARQMTGRRAASIYLLRRPQTKSFIVRSKSSYLLNERVAARHHSTTRAGADLPFNAPP
ncbi:hypothetical protein EVAR_39463_1 [Eumeta japonica]|uniref:Uncharacterized protein n=1 Tax=Eumeta variegata TaxID=151549 RepID=A0A4C1W312_EUMVA|nr:hypothetical protein EVAR_39463_1 [Eumeta japonica]